MRILHVDFDDLHHPWGGGQARRTYEINRRLAAQLGWHVTVVTSRYPGAQNRAWALGSGTLSYRRVGGGRFPLNFLSFVAALPLVVRRYAHDLLVEDFTSPIGPALCPWWTHRPVVGSAQFLFAAEMSRKYGVPFHHLERRALRAYRWLIALATPGAQYLARHAPRAQVAVIPQGLAAEDYVAPEAIDGGGEHALFLGRLDLDQKGLDILLRAWALLTPDHRPPLVLAGHGRNRSRLERLVADLGLGGTVRLVGRVHGHEKRRLLLDARLLCLPSRYETYGIAAAEALAAGKPVVGSDLPALREAAGAGAVLVPPGDPRALAAAVEGLWSDRVRRRRLGLAGRQAVAALTWDDIASRQAAFYQRVLAV